MSISELNQAPLINTVIFFAILIATFILTRYGIGFLLFKKMKKIIKSDLKEKRSITISIMIIFAYFAIGIIGGVIMLTINATTHGNNSFIYLPAMSGFVLAGVGSAIYYSLILIYKVSKKMYSIYIK